MAQALIFTPHSAPAHATDRLLLSYPIGMGSSVPSTVSYTHQRITWTSSSTPSTDRIRLRVVPAAVSAGGKALPRRGQLAAEAEADGWWSYEAATGLATVMHADAKDIVVTTGGAH